MFAAKFNSNSENLFDRRMLQINMSKQILGFFFNFFNSFWICRSGGGAFVTIVSLNVDLGNPPDLKNSDMGRLNLFILFQKQASVDIPDFFIQNHARF